MSKLLSLLLFITLSIQVFGHDKDVTINTLKHLKIINKNIGNISFLNYLEGTEVIHLQNTNVENISVLKKCNELKVLKIYDSPISDLTSLSKLKKIETIEIFGAKITNIEPFKGLQSLKNLAVDLTHVKDISFLHQLSSLETLGIYNFKGSLEKDLKLKELKILSINNSEIINLHSFKDSQNLVTAVFLDSRVSNIDVVSNMKKIQEVEIINCPVTNIEALFQLTHLKRITLEKTKVPRGMVDKFKLKHPNCEVIYLP